MSDLVNNLRRSKFYQRYIVDENANKAADRIELLEAVVDALDYIVNHMTIDRVYGDSPVFKEAREALAAVEDKT